MEVPQVSVNITANSIIKAILFAILLFLLWYLREIVLVVVTAIVLASAMEPAIQFFVRQKVPRLLAVILLYLIIGIAFFSTIFFFIPPVLSDASSFLQQLPQTLATLNLNQATQGLPWAQFTSSFSSADLLNNLSSTITSTTGGVFTTVSAFFGGLTSFVLVVVFSFYFCVQETGVDDFLRIVTPIESQAYVLNLWKRSQDKIGKWMQGQIMLALIIGVLLFLGLFILGVPHPLLLALLAAVFELIPVFGQFLAAIPAVAVAFTASGVKGAVIVLILYVIVQQFEANLIYPVVVKKVVGVPPLLVILALLIGFKLFGFLGVLLSVPLAGAVQEFVNDIDRRKTRALAAKGLAPDGQAE
jgi:predicted PurR-regulated permease PerM